MKDSLLDTAGGGAVVQITSLVPPGYTIIWGRDGGTASPYVGDVPPSYTVPTRSYTSVSKHSKIATPMITLTRTPDGCQDLSLN